VKLLGDYRKAVLEFLESGPKPRYELFKELYPKEMGEKKLQKTLNELEDEELIICVPKRMKRTHKWTSVYALPKHRYLLEVELGQVAKALKYLRLELCRNPEDEEVAAKIAKDPESVRETLFRHALELNWKSPTPEEKEEAKKKRMEARNLAAMTKFSRDDEISLSEVTVEDIINAEFLLKRQFKSIKEADIGSRGLVLGPGFPVPPSPKERSKKEAIEALKKLRNLKKLEP
jgi:hypothetical protein